MSVARIDPDWDTECAVLGAIVNDAALRDEVDDILSTDLFADDLNRQIMRTVNKLRDEKRPVDAVALLSTLREDFTPTAPVVDRALQVCKVWGTANLRFHVERLKDVSLKRAVQAVAQKILADAEGTGAERYERAAKAITTLDAGGVRRARPLGDLMLDVSDRLEKQAAAAAAGLPIDSLFRTGFEGIDRLIGGFRPGILTVFAARPGVGKTASAVAFADNLAAHGTPVGCFWLEDEAEDFATRAIQRRARIASTLMRDGSQLRPEHWERITHALAEGAKLPIYIDDEHALSMLQIAARMRRMSREFGVKVFLLDHLGEVSLDDDRSYGRHDIAVGRALSLYRDTAKQLGACPVVYAQANRDQEKEGRETSKMSDLKDSARIEAAARVLAFFSRSPKDPTTFTVDLIKNTKGPPGRVRLGWLEDYMSVEDPASMVLHQAGKVAARYSGAPPPPPPPEDD